MKAFIYDYSEKLRMRFTADYRGREASLGANEVKVKVASVGLNPIDYKIPDLPGISWLRKGTPVGVELAGEVVEVGERVKNFKSGDLVFGGCSKGSLVDTAVCGESEIATLPQSLDRKFAGGYAAVALTALQSLRAGGLEFSGSCGKRILILGASGGVGHVAVQMAKRIAGCSLVSGVSSAKNAEFVKTQGADEVLDYTKENFRLSEECKEKKFDVIFDAVSNPHFDYEPEARKCLKASEGIYVAINTARNSDWPRAGIAQFTGWNFLQRSNYRLIMCSFNSGDIETVGKWIQEGKLQVKVAKTVPFSEQGVKEGFEQLKTERTVGKVLVQF